MKVVKYFDLLLTSHLENISFTRRTVSTNLGPVSRELNPFRAYFGCHQSCHIFKMTTFHFKSSNFTVSPLFPHLKDVKKQIYQNDLSNRVSTPLLQRPTWSAKKTIGLFGKITKNKPQPLKQQSCFFSWSNKIRACETPRTWYLSKYPFGTKMFLGFSWNEPQIISFIWSIFSYLCYYTKICTYLS